MLKIFSVYDSKAEAHLPPFFAPAKGLALRMFMSACSDTTHDFSKYAADYTLFEIGSFDPETGRVESLPAKVSLGNALEFVSKANGGSV